MPGEYRILSIDGGGIKGLYSASVLAVFEEQWKVKISDCFDMICGTSTGAIIAAALAVGISAEEIVSFYKNEGPQIFPQPNNRLQRGLGKLGQYFVECKYSSDALKSCLTKVFKDKQMKDSRVVLCIPSFNLTHGNPVVFKNDHAANLSRDNDHLIIDILLASTAAPTYFPVHSFSGMNDDSFVDGGLWANNPAFVGVIEALKYYVNPQGGYEKYRLLSVSSVDIPFGYQPKKKSMSGYDWIKGQRLVESIMQAQALNVAHTLGHLNDFLPGEYIRIKSPVLPQEKLLSISLDNASPNALQYLASAGDAVGHIEKMRDEIKNFFQGRDV